MNSVILTVGAGFKPAPTGVDEILVAQAFQPGAQARGLCHLRSGKEIPFGKPGA
jgi:hypothetical protein